MSNILLLPAQCRGARGVLGWTQEQLAQAAGVSRPTVKDFERGARTPHPSNILSICKAIESAGVSFIIDETGSVLIKLSSRFLSENEHEAVQKELDKRREAALQVATERASIKARERERQARAEQEIK